MSWSELRPGRTVCCTRTKMHCWKKKQGQWPPLLGLPMPPSKGTLPIQKTQMFHGRSSKPTAPREIQETALNTLLDAQHDSYTTGLSASTSVDLVGRQTRVMPSGQDAAAAFTKTSGLIVSCDQPLGGQL